MRKIYEERPELLAFLLASACTLAMILVLYFPSSTGLANNGDFLRITAPNGIGFIDEKPNKDRYTPNFIMKYTKSDNDSLVKKLYYFFNTDYSTYDYVSSQSVLIKASKIANFAWNKLTGMSGSNYNICFLSFIYILMMAGAFYLILRFVLETWGGFSCIFSFAVLLLAFCDQGYLLYFNSFYGEALQYASTLLAVGLYLKLAMEKGAGRLHFALYYLAVLMMGMSKYANAPVGIIFATLPIFLPTKKKRRKATLAAASAGVCLILAFYCSSLTARWIEEDTTYNSVFSGVLLGSESPEQDLAELGLNPEFAVLADTESYQKEYPIDVKSEDFKNEFYGKVSKGKIAAFYLKHPARLFQAAEKSMSFAKRIRPNYLANTQEPETPREQSYRFSIWERLRIKSPTNNLACMILVMLAAAVLILRAKNLALSALMSAVLISTGMNFMLPYMGNGISDIAKHMFGFVYLYDMLQFTLAGAALYKLRGLIVSREPLKRKWPVQNM
ncbi:MAG: DUF3077 domain-containing protein [Clostridiales bacterium]|nr:DUF3077 domain-containing protein [Clostridiales bacterium]